MDQNGCSRCARISVHVGPEYAPILKIVIIGGLVAGASTAARARRLNEDAEIIVLEKDEFISFANCGLPYHISGEIKERQA